MYIFKLKSYRNESEILQQMLSTPFEYETSMSCKNYLLISLVNNTRKKVCFPEKFQQTSSQK